MGETGKQVPGFDFLQGLMKSAGTGMPGMSPWIAPTLDPDELKKRIDELRTVQFWLEQNAKMLGHSIQALEVQRMTLSTLKGMNLKVTDLTDAFKLKVPDANAPSPDATPTAAVDPTQAASPAGGTPAEPAAAGPVDPTQWWAALTQQFAEIASKALPAGTGDAARSMATAVHEQLDAARQAATQAATDGQAQALKAMANAKAKPDRAPAKRARARKA